VSQGGLPGPPLSLTELMELVHPRIGRLASRAFLGVLRLPVAVVSWFGHQAPEFLLLGGATALVYGAWQVYHPAGWIVGGVLAVVAGWRLGRTAPTVPEVKRG
jgi:hypothetical protein